MAHTINITKSFSQNDDVALPEYQLQLECTNALNMSHKVFVHQMKNGVPVFVCVASSRQLSDLPMEAPTPDSALFRKATAAFKASNAKILDDDLNAVLEDLRLLASNLDSLDILVNTTNYEINATDINVV